MGRLPGSMYAQPPEDEGSAESDPPGLSHAKAARRAKLEKLARLGLGDGTLVSEEEEDEE